MRNVNVIAIFMMFFIMNTMAQSKKQDGITVTAVQKGIAVAWVKYGCAGLEKGYSKELSATNNLIEIYISDSLKVDFKKVKNVKVTFEDGTAKDYKPIRVYPGISWEWGPALLIQGDKKLFDNVGGPWGYEKIHFEFWKDWLLIKLAE